MGRAIPLRSDFDSIQLRSLARQSADSNQTRRLLALAVIYDGGSRSEAAIVGGVGLQIIRDWVLRLNQKGPAGLVDRKPTGVPPKEPACTPESVWLSRWKSGGRMRPVLARRTRSPGVGPNGGQNLWQRKTNAQNPPGYLGPSAPPGGGPCLATM